LIRTSHSYASLVLAGAACVATLAEASARPSKSASVDAAQAKSASVNAAPATSAQATGASAKVEIAFRPAAGSKATKTFTIEHALALQAFRQEENGVEQASQRGIELSSKEVLRVVDEHRASEGGRPLHLRRMYEEDSFHADIAYLSAVGAREGAEVVDWTTPLVGTSVLFTWVPEESAYGKLYDAKDGIEEALTGLKEDADLRALLPAGPVAVGESWSVAPGAIAAIVAPLGSLPATYVRGGESTFLRVLSAGVGGSLSEIFGGEVEGKIDARLGAVREADGVRLATIAFDVDVVTDGDQRGLLQRGLTGPELVRGIYVESGTIRWTYEAKGELVWNVDAGRFESLKLAGVEDVTADLTLASARGGLSSRQMIRMAGGLKVGAECPRPKTSGGG
jgi:hypothetical protein